MKDDLKLKIADMQLQRGNKKREIQLASDETNQKADELWKRKLIYLKKIFNEKFKIYFRDLRSSMWSN